MDAGFLNWIFIAVTMGCVIFFLQILVDYNRQAGQIRPQIRRANEIQERHNEEIQRVQRLVEETEQEGAKLSEELAGLQERHQELEEVLKELQEPDGE